MAMAMGIFRWRRPGVVVLVLFVVVILSGTARAQAQMTNDDVNSVVDALRASGYHLFANAIQMTPIRDLIVSGSSFTFFAPPDRDVYQLDVASATAADYVRRIQHHVVVLRFSYRSLQGLPRGSNLDTLLPNGGVGVSSNDSDDGAVTVDGVRISVPNLYSADRIVVHGIDGVLDRTGFEPSASKDPITLGGHYPEPKCSAPSLSPSDMDEIVLQSAPAPTRQTAGFRTRHHHRHREHHRSDSDNSPPRKCV